MKQFSFISLLRQKEYRWLWVIIISGLVARILLNSAVDSFDFYAFVMWARYLTNHSIVQLFEFLPEGYTPYPPLYYYVLWFLGQLISILGVWSSKWLTYLIIRTPVIIADVLVTLLVYGFAKKHVRTRHASLAAAFYFLHPAIIYNTAIWGQIDSVVTVLGIVSISTLVGAKPARGIGFFIAGVLTKLQSLALLPLVFFLSATKLRPTSLIRAVFFWLVLACVPFLPMLLTKGIAWTWNYFFTIPNWYAYTSVYTYNLWAPLGFIVSDNLKVFGLIELKYIGIALFWLVAGLILYPLRKTHNRKPIMFMFAAFLLWYDFSFFATRIHSRYLLYSFGFFAPFAVRFPKLAIGLSILMFANLLLPNKTPTLGPLIIFLNQPRTIMLFVSYAFALFLISYNSYRQLWQNKQ